MTSTESRSSTPARAAVTATLEVTRGRVRPWLETREGSAATIVAILLVVIAWGFAEVPFTTALLAGAFGVAVVALAARFWEDRTTPLPPIFAEMSTPAAGTVEVQQDEHAGFWRDTAGFLWSHRVWFAGTGCAPLRLKPGTYGRLRAWHDEGYLPVFVARASERQWWWWQNAFYWESGDYEPEDMHALLTLVQDRNQTAHNGTGHTGAQNGNGPTGAQNGNGTVCTEQELELRFAEPIPDEVKRIVFDRDGGRCVQCGSKDLIQYDRILSFLQGGDNDPDNLRLLCAECNRRHASVMGWTDPN